jgi:hypothetical protein
VKRRAALLAALAPLAACKAEVGLKMKSEPAATPTPRPDPKDCAHEKREMVGYASFGSVPKWSYSSRPLYACAGCGMVFVS